MQRSLKERIIFGGTYHRHYSSRTENKKSRAYKNDASRISHRPETCVSVIYWISRLIREDRLLLELKPKSHLEACKIGPNAHIQAISSHITEIISTACDYTVVFRRHPFKAQRRKESETTNIMWRRTRVGCRSGHIEFLRSRRVLRYHNLTWSSRSITWMITRNISLLLLLLLLKSNLCDTTACEDHRGWWDTVIYTMTSVVTLIYRIFEYITWCDIIGCYRTAAFRFDPIVNGPPENAVGFIILATPWLRDRRYSI